VEEVTRDVLDVLKHPESKGYILFQRYATLLSIILRHDFRHLFLMRDSRHFRRVGAGLLKAGYLSKCKTPQVTSSTKRQGIIVVSVRGDFKLGSISLSYSAVLNLNLGS